MLTANKGNGKVSTPPAMKLSRPSLTLILLFIGLLLAIYMFPPLNALEVADQTTCTNIDFTTLTCEDRTSAFLVTDEWAYFWFNANFGKSDVGAKAELKFYDSSGHEVAHMYGPMLMNPAESMPWPVGDWMVGETVVWMGVGISKPIAEGGVLPSKSQVDLSMLEKDVMDIRGSESQEKLNYNSQGGFTYFVWAYKSGQSALEKPGAWVAVFTLDEKPTVSEHFTIGQTATTAATTVTTAPQTTSVTAISTGVGTQSAVVGLSKPFIIGGAAIVGIIASIAGYTFLRSKRRPRTQ
jgi:hypothetical protein